MAVAVLFVAAAAGEGRSRLLTGATLVGRAARMARSGQVHVFRPGTTLVVLVTVWLCATRRRIGPALPAYAVAWLAFWLLCGPTARSRARLRRQRPLGRGGVHPRDVALVRHAPRADRLRSAALTVALAIVLERGYGRRFPVVGMAYALILYVAFKAGFVRQDEWQHRSPSSRSRSSRSSSGSVHRPGGPLRAADANICDRCATAIAVCAWWVAAVPGPAQHVADIIRSSDETLAFFVRPGRAEASRRVGWSSALAEVRRKIPLPSVTGTADLYPDDQLVIVANGARRLSRPVFQSYSAYTPRLIALNDGTSAARRPAAHDLRRPRADRRPLAIVGGRAEPDDDPLRLPPRPADALVPRVP